MTTVQMKVGAYCKRGSSLAQITDVSENGSASVRYVPSGGYSCWWSQSELAPVTDPVEIAVCRQDEAEQRRKRAESEASKAAHDAKVWACAVEALKESRSLGSAHDAKVWACAVEALKESRSLGSAP